MTLENSIHTGYNIRTVNGQIVIDYKKTSRQWFHFIFNALLGAILIYFPSHLLYSSKHFSWTTNTVLVTGFFALLMLWGLFKLVIACEILVLPAGSLIIIDKHEKTITVRLAFFQTTSFSFDSIKLIQLSGHDTLIENYNEDRTYKKRLYFHQLQFLLKNGQVKKIHKFVSGKILIPVLQKRETAEVSTISKYIAKLIASETGIKYTWLGTKRT